MYNVSKIMSLFSVYGFAKVLERGIIKSSYDCMKKFLKYSEVRYQDHLVCPQLKFQITKNRSKSWKMLLNRNICIIFTKYLSLQQNYWLEIIQ